MELVKTQYGIISGQFNSSHNVYSFKGVPYAAPPVGKLRWREPMAVKPWAGILKCDHFRASAIQADPLPNPPWTEEFMPAPGQISEDCLYLNVWTGAKKAGEKRPVIVWIHGGAFVAGSGSVPVYDGEEMARKGVVFVTINYRLGILGFLAHPQLSAESEHHVSGNYGILDQIAALKWVKKNIAAFGGDADNVTIDGQSAGSCCVNTLIASPLAKGLFKRGIAESGQFFAANQCLTLKEAEEEGKKLMEAKHANSVTEMRKLSTDELLKDDYMRLPVVDNYLLPDQIDRIFEKGQELPADLIIGYNEGDEFVDDIISAKDYRAQIQKLYGDKAESFLKDYPGSTDQEAARSQKYLSRDKTFAWLNYKWAQLQITKGRVWYYYFDRVPPGTPRFGAFHSAEVPYSLGTLSHWNRPFTAIDAKLSSIMNNYWINFAKTGNPNGKALPEWTLFSQSPTKVIQLGDTVKTIPLPAKPRFKWFE
ncbi:MAG: carboxylesterase family protein [Bacteroidetes bacterium]|nr:carboxylesterase family protein [Bacteroidota bacterium]